MATFMQSFKPGAAYFGLVFGGGFLLGCLRVPFLVPRLGARIAELVEMPFEFVIIVFAARYIVRRFAVPGTTSARLKVGLVALLLALAAELLLALALARRSVLEYIASRDPVSGSVYLAMLVVFALLPLALARRQAIRARATVCQLPYAITKRHRRQVTREILEGENEMSLTFTASARRLGIAAAIGTVFLIGVYAFTLCAGLLSLPSPQAPIGDPMFSILEILIILLMPPMIALMVAVHAWASEETKVYGLLALVFMSLLAAVTCSVHFVILVIGHQAESSGPAWMALIFSFKWPSVPYALDILAWDVFFALSVLCAAPIFSGGRLANSIRALLLASGALALAGLSGVIFADMRLRMIGVVGYVGVFPVVALLLGILFSRSSSLGTAPKWIDRQLRSGQS